MSSAAKHVTTCQGRENKSAGKTRRYILSARKHTTLCSARENMQVFHAREKHEGTF